MKPDTITEKYLRRWPDSKKSREWSGAMVYLSTKNGIWRPGGHGYTTDLSQAWMMSIEGARRIVSGIYEDHGGVYIRAPKKISLVTGTVRDISDDDLLRRAVVSARGPRKMVKWAAVMQAFGLGSTYAKQLCMRFGIDPDMMEKSGRSR